MISCWHSIRERMQMRLITPLRPHSQCHSAVRFSLPLVCIISSVLDFNDKRFLTTDHNGRKMFHGVVLPAANDQQYQRSRRRDPSKPTRHSVRNTLTFSLHFVPEFIFFFIYTCIHRKIGGILNGYNLLIVQRWMND
jgi:hypothetical protein